jgi:hypothetical protein
MIQPNTPSQNCVENFDKTFDLYKLLIEENRHLHQVWIDNFRIILTFNSILLAGAFALLTIQVNGKPLTSTALPLYTISVIGIIVTLVGIHLIRRIKAITSLRLTEIRHLETTALRPKMPVSPFEEGAVVLGTSTEETFVKNRPNPPYLVEPLKCNPFSALGGYYLISASFILSYIVIIVLRYFFL